jgi:hypothetical protein
VKTTGSVHPFFSHTAATADSAGNNNNNNNKKSPLISSSSSQPSPTSPSLSYRVAAELGSDAEPTWALFVADVRGVFGTDRFSGVPRDPHDVDYPRGGAFPFMMALRLDVEYHNGGRDSVEMPLARSFDKWVPHYEPVLLKGRVKSARAALLADGVAKSAVRIRNVGVVPLPGAPVRRQPQYVVDLTLLPAPPAPSHRVVVAWVTTQLIVALANVAVFLLVYARAHVRTFLVLFCRPCLERSGWATSAFLTPTSKLAEEKLAAEHTPSSAPSTPSTPSPAAGAGSRRSPGLLSPALLRAVERESSAAGKAFAILTALRRAAVIHLANAAACLCPCVPSIRQKASAAAGIAKQAV